MFVLCMFELDDVYCRNYIYPLTCKNCGIQYIGESITSVNLRMNIHQKSKSGCEHSINHHKNVCKVTIFSIHILEKLEGHGQRDFAVQKFLLQREDYWMKKLHIMYAYGLNQIAKNSNLGQPTGKLFPPFPRFSNRRKNLEKKVLMNQLNLTQLISY